MSFMTSEMYMVAIAATGKATTLEIGEVVDQVAVADNKLRGFLDRVAM